MKLIRNLILLLPLYGLIIADTLGADYLPVKLVRTHDGDSLVVRTINGRRYKVRLYGIDCPELGQPWGFEAKQALSLQVPRHKIMGLEIIGRDRYRRYLANLYVDDTLVNETLVAEGHCWAYKTIADDHLLREKQLEAQQAAQGLWALPTTSQVAPWVWRRQQKQSVRTDDVR